MKGGSFLYYPLFAASASHDGCRLRRLETFGTSGMRVLRFVVGRAILLHRPIEIVVALVIDVRRTMLDGQVVFESGLAVASIDQAGFVGLLQRLFPCWKSTAYLLLILRPCSCSFRPGYALRRPNVPRARLLPAVPAMSAFRESSFR
jgi:hypothetical protein